MQRTTMKQTVIMAVIMITIALICLVIIKHNLIDTGLITWDSQLGYMVSTAPIGLVIYSILMLIIKRFKLDEFYMDTDIPQVMGNEGGWKAKDVHWPSKFRK